MGFEPGYNAEGDYYVSNVEGRQIINKLSESIVTRELARQILSEFKTNESGFIKVLSDGNDEAYDTFEILDSVKKQKNVYEVTYFGWNAKAGRDAGKSEKQTFTFEKNDDGDYVIKSVTK